MHEHLEAIRFYRVILSALKANGIESVKVYLDNNGDMVADVIMTEQTEEEKREEKAENQLAIKEAFDA